MDLCLRSDVGNSCSSELRAGKVYGQSRQGFTLEDPWYSFQLSAEGTLRSNFNFFGPPHRTHELI
ncbi:hypothetical protein Mapa_011517 [Marchantia paleacea]|nr:hypothetical protein Mapa_011517 [Marchantia paleacea]